MGGALFILLYLVGGLLIPPATVRYRSRPAGEKVRFWLIGLAGSAIAMLLGKWLWLTPSGIQHFVEHNASGPLTVYGLSSWAGFFWATCLSAMLSGRHAIPLGGRRIDYDREGDALTSGVESEG